MPPEHESLFETQDELKNRMLAEFSIDVLSSPGVSLRAQELSNNILEKFLTRAYNSMLTIK